MRHGAVELFEGVDVREWVPQLLRDALLRLQETKESPHIEGTIINTNMERALTPRRAPSNVRLSAFEDGQTRNCLR